MKIFLRMAALVLAVAATVATGESQAKPARPAVCGGGCTTTIQCAKVCGGPGNAICVDGRCIPE